MNESGSRLRNILKSYRFSIILLTGVVAGALLGVVLGEKTAVLQPFADIFLNMVFCLIVPVVPIWAILASWEKYWACFLRQLSLAG